MDIGQDGMLRSGHFSIQDVDGFCRRREKVSIHTLKVTINLFFTNDSFNSADGSRMTFSRESRPIFTM